jgi:hypothetical protein
MDNTLLPVLTANLQYCTVIAYQSWFAQSDCYGIRFYEIHTPLTEAVLPDKGNYKRIVYLCYLLR